MRTQRFVYAIVVLAAAFMIVAGVWCWLDPAGFARMTNWPVHEHFLHDAGVFQIGIGLMLLFALRWRDVIAVVLAGFLITNTLHAANHWLDLAHGGHASDPWALLAMSALAATALTVRLRMVSRAAR